MPGKKCSLLAAYCFFLINTGSGKASEMLKPSVWLSHTEGFFLYAPAAQAVLTLAFDPFPVLLCRLLRLVFAVLIIMDPCQAVWKVLLLDIMIGKIVGI